jgi:hypothetical protein
LQSNDVVASAKEDDHGDEKEEEDEEDEDDDDDDDSNDDPDDDSNDDPDDDSNDDPDDDSEDDEDDDSDDDQDDDSDDGQYDDANEKGGDNDIDGGLFEEVPKNLRLKSQGRLEILDFHCKSSAFGKLITYQQTLQLGLNAVKCSFTKVVSGLYTDDDEFWERLFSLIFYNCGGRRMMLVGK